MPGSNAGTGQPLHFFCAKCRRGRGWDDRSTSDRRGWNVLRTGRTKPYKGGNRGTRGLDTFHEYHCLDCSHTGWSRHIAMRTKLLGWYVEIVETTSGKVEKRMGPMPEHKADSVERGALMRIREGFFVRTGTAQALAQGAGG